MLKNYQGTRNFFKMLMDKISLVLVIIGALNWGSVGLFDFDVVGFICGGTESMIARIIFTVVGLAGLWCVSLLFRPSEYYRESTND